jgi:hypothetical protein
VGEGVCALVGFGVPQAAAAEAVGIGESTVQSWIAGARDARTMPEKDRTAQQSRLVEFLARLENARGGAIAFNVAVVHKAAAAGNWQAAMTWLERRYPADFGRRINVTDDKPPADAPPLDAQTVAEHETALKSAFRDQIPELDPADLLAQEAADE